MRVLAYYLMWKAGLAPPATQTTEAERACPVVQPGGAVLGVALTSAEAGDPRMWLNWPLRSSPGWQISASTGGRFWPTGPPLLPLYTGDSPNATRSPFRPSTSLDVKYRRY